MIATLSASSFSEIFALEISQVDHCADFSSIATSLQRARKALSNRAPAQYHLRIVAAINPISTESGKPSAGSSSLMNFVKIAIIVAIVVGSIWLLIEHWNWVSDPATVKAEVITWGAWGPVVYLL